MLKTLWNFLFGCDGGGGCGGGGDFLRTPIQRSRNSSWALRAFFRKPNSYEVIFEQTEWSKEWRSFIWQWKPRSRASTRILLNICFDLHSSPPLLLEYLNPSKYIFLQFLYHFWGGILPGNNVEKVLTFYHFGWVRSIWKFTSRFSAICEFFFNLLS